MWIGLTLSILLIITLAGVFVYAKTHGGDKEKPFYDALQLYNLGRYPEAVQSFHHCVYDNPYNSLYHWYLALSYLKSGNAVKAVTPLNEIIKIDNYTIPDYSLPETQKFNRIDVLYQLLHLFETLKITEEQIKICRRLWEAQPHDSRHPIRIAQLKFDAGAFDNEVKDILLEVLTENPEAYQAKYMLALWYFKKGMYEEALQTSRPLAASDPDNLAANFIIGESLYKLGVKDEAMPYYSRAAQTKEFLKTTAYRLAALNREKGVLDSAFTYARQSVEAAISKFEDPKIDLYSRYFLGELCELTGDYPEAVELYKYVHQIDPNFLEIEEKMKFFKPAMESDEARRFDKLKLSDFRQAIDDIMDKMNFKIIRMESGSENAMNIIAETKGTNFDKAAIFIRRNVNLLDVDQVDLLIKFMDSIRAHQGVFVTSGSFTAGALELMRSADIRPIHGEALSTYLRAKR